MSWQHHPGDGAYGPNDGAYGSNAANGAASGYPAGASHPGGGEDRNQPNVYHPYAVAEPDYDGYADPAAAHGWQNAYDETRELPVTIGGMSDPGAVGRTRASRRRARTPSRSPLPRRAALAVGALGAVGVVVALAGGFGSGSSGAPADAGQSARPEAAPSASPTEATASSTATEPSRTAASVAAVTKASATPGASRGAAPVPAASETPTSAAPTARASSASPTVTASATTPGNFGGRPGRGRGATKAPK
jgi:hypothetical protein